MDDELTDAIRDLLAAARTSARTPEVEAAVAEIQARIEGPLRLAIAGKVKAGKSTLLNALLGEELAATDAGECTQIITWYQQAETPSVTLYPHDGPPERRPFRRAGGVLEIDLDRRDPGTIDHLEVGWPNPRLRDLTLVDTPGIASIAVDISARTHRFLGSEEDGPPAVDAVLYLLRHTHASDARFLESFHDDDLVQGSPMNVVGVLSRSDEIGSCRLDSLEVARRIAERYQSDPRVRRLCPIVLPVAGLLGYAGATLRESEYRALRQVADLPGPEQVKLLLTVDRFVSRPAVLTDLERTHLIQRLGLFGVRLSVELITSGSVRDATTLARQLVALSGLDPLRGVLSRQFTERSRTLKARSALANLKPILAGEGFMGAPSLRSRVEEIELGTHAFEELRLLTGLRSDELGLNDERREELDRLLGGSGHDPISRLGLAQTATKADIATAALEVLGRWQRVAEHPISSRSLQLAARGACRTVEGLYVSAGASPPDPG